MITIKYKIPKPAITNTITINKKDYIFLNDLKEKIASELKLKPDQFSFENLINDQDLAKITDDFEINLKINSGCGDVKFHLPNGKIMNIKNGSKMTYSEIINNFEHNWVCYSEQCQLKNLNFKIFDQKINRTDFPLINVPPSFEVEVQLSGDFITIEFEKIEFTFAEKEKIFEANKLICSQFKQFTSENYILIKDKNSPTIYKSQHGLIKTENYKIVIKCPFEFRNKAIDKLNSRQIMYISDTIYDSRRILSYVYDCKPENIVIFDKDNKKIEDDTKLLRNIKDSHDIIFFDIDVNVNHTKSEKQTTQKVTEDLHIEEEEEDTETDIKEENKETTQKVTEDLHIEEEEEDTNTDIKEEEKSKAVTKVTEKSEPVTKPSLDDKKSKSSIPSNNQTANATTTTNNNNKTPHSEQPKKKHGMFRFQPNLTRVLSSTENFSNEQQESSIKVNFVFDEDNVDKFSPFEESINLNTTITEIEDKLIEKFGIEGKVTIECKDGDEKTPLGRKTTIESDIDDISEKDKNGTTKYVLYVKITKQKSPKKITQKSVSSQVVSKPIRPNESSKKEESKLKPNTKSSHLSDDDKDEVKSKKTKPLKKRIISSSSSSDNDTKSKKTKTIAKKHKKISSSDDDDDNKKIKKQTKKEEVKGGKSKYYYQTNKMDDIQEIELPKGADVRELKKVIAKENEVKDLSNIKVIFAGKDLIDKLILDELEIGDIPLYIYIRSLEDIILMTAKALVIKKEDLDNFEEEEEDLY